MSKLIFILYLGIFIFVTQTENFSSESVESPFKYYSGYQIKHMSLRGLLVHRAEVYAAKGYRFKNMFLQNEMKKRKWYDVNKNYSYSLFSKKEIDYIFLLSKEIRFLKSKTLKNLITKLQNYLKNKMVIKFSLIKDLNSDGYYDLVAICGKKFNISEKKLDNEASYRYYKNPNELYLLVLGRNFFSKIKLSSEIFGRAEYINHYESQYLMGNGRPQIKIILHSLPIINGGRAVHKQKLYLFDLDKNRLKVVFSHDIYKAYHNRKKESITEFALEFKNISGDEFNEIIVVKTRNNRVYGKAESPLKNYKDKVFKSHAIYFRYDPYSRVYKRFNYKKNRTN